MGPSTSDWTQQIGPALAARAIIEPDTKEGKDIMHSLEFDPITRKSRHPSRHSSSEAAQAVRSLALEDSTQRVQDGAS